MFDMFTVTVRIQHFGAAGKTKPLNLIGCN